MLVSLGPSPVYLRFFQICITTYICFWFFFFFKFSAVSNFHSLFQSVEAWPDSLVSPEVGGLGPYVLFSCSAPTTMSSTLFTLEATFCLNKTTMWVFYSWKLPVCNHIWVTKEHCYNICNVFFFFFWCVLDFRSWSTCLQVIKILIINWFLRGKITVLLRFTSKTRRGKKKCEEKMWDWGWWWAQRELNRPPLRDRRLVSASPGSGWSPLLHPDIWTE